MNTGWFPDPTGRFGQRWYDGHNWTPNVVAANGQSINDPLPAGAPPYPPPARAAAPASPTGAPRPGPPAFPQQPMPGAAARVKYLPGVALIAGVLGMLLVAASLLGAPWAEDLTFLDISESARDADLDYFKGWDLALWFYAGFGGFVLLGLALVFVVLAGIPLPSTQGGDTSMRIIACGICALAVVLHTITVVRMFRGPADPGVGAWLGIAGYFVVIVGLAIGNRRKLA